MLSDKYRSESLVYYFVQRKSYPASDALPLNPAQLLYNGTYHQKGRWSSLMRLMLKDRMYKFPDKQFRLLPDDYFYHKHRL